MKAVHQKNSGAHLICSVSSIYLYFDRYLRLYPSAYAYKIMIINSIRKQGVFHMSICMKKCVKKVISLSIAFVMALTVIPMMPMTAHEAQAAGSVSAFARQKVNFNREWKFVRRDVENAQDENYNDSSWYNVGLPHDFSIPYWQEEKHYTGYGWYRKTFDVKNEWIGKRLSLDFEGVFHTAELYINGQYVGVHEGGYTGFEFDITDYVRQGKNTVAIRVNNNWKADLAPRTGEHMFTGGIYRDVNLVVTSPVHVTWYGTFVQTPDISAERSNVRMQTEISNDSAEAQTVNVVNQVFDAEKRLVTTIASGQQVIAAGQTYNFDNTSGYINNPNLWSPDSPYLYTMHTDVQVNGQSVDQYDTTFGFRWAEFTSDSGFYLNGEHLWLDGANAHQDHAGWANAVTAESLKRDVAMIKEAGLNFIRGSHYPHSPAYADACDELGVLFWSEAAFWGTAAGGEGGKNGNSEDYKADSYPTTGNAETEKAFEESCLANVRDMIRVNRNHPSIIAWSMGNEVFFGTNHEKKKALISEMAGYAKELDPTRATAMGGTQRQGYDKLENVDVAGYNGDGASMQEYQDPGVANMVAEYASHTGNRPDQFKAYYGNVKVDGSGNPEQPEWRSGQVLWCAFHHGSIMARSYGDMGFIDYYRLPLQSWYYYRWMNTGVERECSSKGTPAKLSLSATDTEISNDGTSDTQIIVTVEDENGVWVDSTPSVTLEVIDGPGVFPTGKTMTFEPGDSMRDGKAAIEFRSYYAGETVIKAYSESDPDLEPATITIKTTGSGAADEPGIDTMYGAFMSNGGYVPNSLEEPAQYSYHNYNGSPLKASSGEASVVNMQDGNDSTEWRAGEAGSGQWIYMELEHGGINLYKAKLKFNGKVYPYKIQYKKMNIDEDEWITLKEYDSSTINFRPEEESFGGTYMRYIRIEFTDVPANEYANLAELRLYGIRSDVDGYKTGMKYLSDIPLESETYSGEKASVGDSGTVNVQTDSELVYNLDKEGCNYTRFQCVAGSSEASAESPVTLQIYCDEELIYERKISDSSKSEAIDISVSKVKKLKLVATSEGGNVNASWTDAKFIGALRNISLANQSVTTNLFSSREILSSGGTLELQARLANDSELRLSLAAGVMLYKADGTLAGTQIVPLDVPAKGKLVKNMSMKLPDDLSVSDNVKFIIWDKDTLVPVTETVTITKETTATLAASDFTALQTERNETGLLSAVKDAMGTIYSGDANRYTLQSRAGYTEALIHGSDVYNDKTVAQAELDTAEAAIRAAIARLTLVPVTVPENAQVNNPVNNGSNVTTQKAVTSKPKKGSVYKVGKIKYKVLKFTGKTGNVSVQKMVSKNVKVVTIPAVVKIKGYSFKVTSIAKKAFYNNKKLTKVVIGKNVTNISKNAFYGNKNLKTVVIKSKKLNKAGVLKKLKKNSFVKTNKKCVFKK